MKAPTCPTCGKPPAPPHTPFCSRGCKDRDLLRWFGERYRIPGSPLGSDGLDSDRLNRDRLDRDRLDSIADDY